jgi:hypothetical protein
VRARVIELALGSGARLYRDVCDARALGELLDGGSELPVMSFNVGSGQWFEFKLAGTAQVTTAAAAAPSCSPPLQHHWHVPQHNHIGDCKQSQLIACASGRRVGAAFCFLGIQVVPGARQRPQPLRRHSGVGGGRVRVCGLEACWNLRVLE